VLTDFAACPDWNPFVVQAGGRAAPGSGLELRMPLPGRRPTTYKHLPDKAALAAAYRGFAIAHPHLYRLMNNGPLPRQHLPPGLEDRTAAPVLRVAGSQARARALWAFAHGMVMLELDHRFPPDADLDRAWQAGIAAFQPA